MLILGAITTRFGKARVPSPGGCNLGDRKYDIHLDVLRSFGAEVVEDSGFLITSTHGKKLVGTDIYLPIRSTGATENALLIATLASGRTRIFNPHIRPEILDLIKFLNSMGANIHVYGQERIEINGVQSLKGSYHNVIPDNMEAITWLIAAGMTGGDIEIDNFPYFDLEVVLAHLRSAGANLYRNDNSLIIKNSKCYPLEISTGPHPGINSDVQPLLAAWAAVSNGFSKIIDLRFPGRYQYASEMKKMNVKSEIVGDLLVIDGAASRLKGATVFAHDLRAGAALALCGLAAEGSTTIENAWQIERGYVDFDLKLKQLGAYCEWDG